MSIRFPAYNFWNPERNWKLKPRYLGILTSTGLESGKELKVVAGLRHPSPDGLHAAGIRKGIESPLLAVLCTLLLSPVLESGKELKGKKTILHEARIRRVHWNPERNWKYTGSEKMVKAILDSGIRKGIESHFSEDFLVSETEITGIRKGIERSLLPE